MRHVLNHLNFLLWKGAGGAFPKNRLCFFFSFLPAPHLSFLFRLGPASRPLPGKRENHRESLVLALR